MPALEQITEIVSERGSALDRDDMDRITELSVEVPLEDSDALAMVMEGVAMIVNDPLYEGDVPPME
jgi:hypothetical protein